MRTDEHRRGKTLRKKLKTKSRTGTEEKSVGYKVERQTGGTQTAEETPNSLKDSAL